MGFGATLGMQAAEQATGAILGMGLGWMNDQRQIGQQGRLQALQIKGQKEMADYNMKKQMEMWNETNYAAQIAHMKKAGLSPGLIYGKGGAGGAIAGNPAGSVTGGTAPTGGREVQDIMGMGLMAAQKANIEADTAKKQAETAKTSGVDTQEAQTRILDLTQGIENKKAQEIMTRVQTRIANIDEMIKGESAQDSIDRIAWETGKALSEMEMAERETYIQKATMNDKIDTVKAEMFGAWLKNAMIKAGTANIQQNTIVSQKMLPLQMMEKIRQGIQTWNQIDINKQGADANTLRQQQDAWINDVQKSTGLPMELLKEAADGILRKSPTKHVQINTERNYY